MTHDETMIFNNMTNAIKNLEQSKSVNDIIDDLNKLILTLRGRNYDIIEEPEQVKIETKPEQSKHIPEPVKAVTVTTVHATKDKTVTVTKAAGLPASWRQPVQSAGRPGGPQRPGDAHRDGPSPDTQKKSG